jgi:antitoxin component HigA of HigAB toxin-antitoxin module
LSGNRKLTVKHIEKLSAYFHVPPSVFFDDVRTGRRESMT